MIQMTMTMYDQIQYTMTVWIIIQAQAKANNG